MRIIICGDRNWNNSERIDTIFAHLQYARQGTPTIIEGGARGADTLARTLAKKYGFTVITVNAEWDKYGVKAGPIRNRKMLNEHGPIDEVIAFHNDLDKSKGTRDMVNYALSKHVPVMLVSDTEVKWLN